MVKATRMGVFLLAFCAGFACLAADNHGATERVRLIAGLAEEKAYLPRFHAIRALENEPPLSDAERAALTAFLRRTDGTEGTDEMELAALKNDVAERLLSLPDMPGCFARDLLDMQADPAQSATWRNYCIQFLGRAYTATPDAELRKTVRERLYALADADGPETCGTALMSLASLNGHPEIDSLRVSDCAMALAKDAAKAEGLRFTALQVAADLSHADATQTAREWLAREKSANMRAVAIGILGKHGASSDRALIEPYVDTPDPRLSGAARAALKHLRGVGLGNPVGD